MKPPLVRARFESNHRSYHRHQAGDASSWDAWAGGKSSGGGKLWKRVGIAVAVLGFLALVAVLVYELM